MAKNPIDTVRMDIVQSKSVDQTAKKLLDRLEEIESEIADLDAERSSIKTALDVAEIRPALKKRSVEHRYRRRKPFETLSLKEACLSALRDNPGDWLNKTHVEYLVRRGGYEFSAKDSKNSVDVTLRRLADDGLCEVERSRGIAGNKYRYAEQS